MTTHQKTEFDKYGCVSRSIMHIAGLSSIDSYCSKFEKWFDPRYYGMTRLDKLGEIAQEFNFRVEEEIADYDEIKRRFILDEKFIVLSHVHFFDSSELHHASVLHSITDAGFELWTSSQDGSARVLPAFRRADWLSKRCSGIPFITILGTGNP